MTLLGQIRKKSWLVVVFIAVALVSFFINPDTVEKMMGNDPNVFGEVNGEKITRERVFRNSQYDAAAGTAARAVA